MRANTLFTTANGIHIDCSRHDRPVLVDGHLSNKSIVVPDPQFDLNLIVTPSHEEMMREPSAHRGRTTKEGTHM
jgi:hypothetical protein